MKTLTFVDKTSVSITDDSTISHMTCHLATFTHVQPIADAFTAENMKTCAIDDESYSNIIPVSATATATEDGVQLVLTTRVKSEMEVMADQITELQEAMAEMAGE